MQRTGAAYSAAATWGWSNVVLGLLLLMERFGVTTAPNVQPDGLAERMLHDIVASNGIVIGSPLVSARAHMPA